jgi:hypothetical protein
VVRKFFPHDKNYLLEEVQLDLQHPLLGKLVRKIILLYEQQNNPLGLRDAISEKLLNFQWVNDQPLASFYQNLAAAYRYKCSNNQLEFLWDGQDHQKKYAADWEVFFEEMTQRFCAHPLFVQAVLDLSVFLPENPTASLAESRMNHFIQLHLEVKFHKQRGIVERVA